MHFFVHYLAFLVYAFAGFMVSEMAPGRVDGVDLWLGRTWGVCVFLLFLGVHTTIAMGGLRRRLQRDLASLRQDHEVAVEALDAARSEARQIGRLVVEAEERRGARDRRTDEGIAAARTTAEALRSELEIRGAADHESLENVMVEVNVLRGLIHRLSPGRQPTGWTGNTIIATDVAAGNAAAGNAAISNSNAAAVLATATAAAAPAADHETTTADAGSGDGAGRRREMPPVAKDLDEDAVLETVRRGLRDDRVDLVVQPIVTLPQRKHIFYECFSRIHDGEGRIIEPAQYLEIARASGLIAPIDNMLLFRCVQLIRRARSGPKNVRFFCNISANTLADTPFLRDFIAFMAENTDLASSLVFELAQADVARMDEDIVYNLSRLGGLGFRFSMDHVTDPGMDYPELARHHFRYIKVRADALLDQMSPAEGEDAATGFDAGDFRSMLERLGIELIVEKIENEGQLVELLDVGARYGQGYLFGEPRLSRAA